MHKSIQKRVSMTEHPPTLQNVVSFARINTESLDLRQIAAKLENSRYNKKRFPAVILRKTNPKGTVLIFKSGRMIIIGCGSKKDAEDVSKKVAKDMGKYLNIKAKCI